MPKRTKHFLALGDSYTIGESVDESARWPAQLCGMLEQRMLQQRTPQRWQLQIIAKTGWSIDELNDAIDAALDQIKPPYDLVSLLIGVNNQYRGRNVEEYRQQFNDLLLRAIGFANDQSERVLVLSIPDWGLTPFAANDKRSREQIGLEIDAFNAAAAGACKALHVRYIDITAHSRSATPDLLAADHLHPSAAAYKAWAAIAFKALN